MAHGDYKCCAICDSKQEYIGLNDTFKDDICPYCREVSEVATIKDLLKKIESFTNKRKLRVWLKKIGMNECYYQNEVDDLIVFKLKGAVPTKFKSATEFLKGIGAL
jgi:hypothetical protein